MHDQNRQYTPVYLLVYFCSCAHDKNKLQIQGLRLELDFSQNTKIVGNILKYLGVNFGDVSISFDRANPHGKSVDKNQILPYWIYFTFWPVLILLYTPYATLNTTKLHIAYTLPFTQPITNHTNLIH